MLAHPHVSVLGTSVATFSGETIRESGNGTRIKDRQPQHPGQDTAPGAVHLPVSGVQRITRHPTDPDLLEWSMLFSCCLAHPSVMLRRDRVVEVGGYDPKIEPAEDYDLWLRMQSSDPGCVANVGEVRSRDLLVCSLVQSVISGKRTLNKPNLVLLMIPRRTSCRIGCAVPSLR